MEKRSQEILLAVIKEHIKTAQPVGSEILQTKYKFGVSSATIRNDLLALERDGYLYQPHTSAGRIPTAVGFSYWVENLNIRKLPEKEIVELQAMLESNEEDALKKIAKELAKLSGAAVVWAFHRRDVYYTGISNLLTQPEFVGSNLIYDISSVVDRIEDILSANFDRFNLGLEIMVGEVNPFSKFCSAIVLKYQGEVHTGLVGILGPLRQDYEKNVALLKIIESNFQQYDRTQQNTPQ